MVSILPDPSAPWFNSQHSQKNFRGKNFDVAEVNQLCWFEGSGHWLENTFKYLLVASQYYKKNQRLVLSSPATLLCSSLIMKGPNSRNNWMMRFVRGVCRFLMFYSIVMQASILLFDTSYFFTPGCGCKSLLLPQAEHLWLIFFFFGMCLNQF